MRTPYPQSTHCIVSAITDRFVPSPDYKRTENRIWEWDLWSAQSCNLCSIYVLSSVAWSKHKTQQLTYQLYSPWDKPVEWELWPPCCLGERRPLSPALSSVRWDHSALHRGIPPEPWRPCWYTAQAAARLHLWELLTQPWRCMKKGPAVKLHYPGWEKSLILSSSGQETPTKDL